MKPIDYKMRTNFMIQGNKVVRNSTKRIKRILDANHKKANLKTMNKILKYLSNDKKVFNSIIIKEKWINIWWQIGQIDSEYKVEL